MNEFEDLFKEYDFLKLERESYIEFSNIANLAITIKLSAELMRSMIDSSYNRDFITEKIKTIYKKKNNNVRKVNVIFNEID